jgi:putative ribosome biogenesis GTPase RsgA
MIGDTGVGKSTIMTFLSGSELVVKFDGLKPILDTVKQNRIKNRPREIFRDLHSNQSGN